MRLNLDGKRMPNAKVVELLALLDWLDLSAALTAQGYHLCPVRARRRPPPDGRLPVRLTWKLAADGGEMTVRLKGTVAVTPV